MLLGLASWLLGGGAIAKPETRCLSLASLGLCGASLLAQLLEVHRRVEQQDWSALLDTMDAVLLAAIVLLVVTAALKSYAEDVRSGSFPAPENTFR